MKESSRLEYKINANLSKLKEKGVLRLTGLNKNAYWEIINTHEKK
jgi:hypothetical protein